MLSAIFPQVLLSSNNGAPVREAGRVTVVRDILGEGPLAGIYAGLCAATSDYLYVCACDMPFINAGFIRYVTALIAQDAARAATKDIYIYRAVPKPGGKNAGYEPFNAFYRKTLVHSAEAALEEGVYKLTPFIESASLRILGEEETARFGGETMFWNVNDAKDLRNAEEL
jgi:molybdopterin-guanine dinucleotide biosynthesis protein A